jgi:iron complex transport system substrate-binding protein
MRSHPLPSVRRRGGGSAAGPPIAARGTLRTPALRLRRTAVVVLLVCLASVALAQRPTVVDDLGREVALTAAAARVVSMVPSHTEMLCALGACDRIVGRDTLSDAPGAAAAPTLGTAFAPDLEALVALAPDLVLVDEYGGLAAALAALGIASYAGTPQRLDELRPYLAALGVLLDLAPEAEVLADDIDRGLEAVRSAVAGLPRPTVFVELDPTPYAAGPDSWIGALVTIAGGAHVLPAAMGDFPLVDPEFVVAADPEVILLLDAPYGVSAAAVAARPGWSGVRAVRDGRVIELDEDAANALSRPGPRIVEAAWLVAGYLHPGRF